MAKVSDNKSTEALRRDLFSGDDALVRSAINKCREEGNASMVEPLIAFYASGAAADLRAEVGDMLSSLKVSGVDRYFIEALERPEWKHVRKDLVACMWNSGLQPVSDFQVITRLATDDDYALVLECLTLLDSLETHIPESVLLDSIGIMRSHLKDHKKSAAAPLQLDFLAALERHSLNDTEEDIE